MASFTGKIYLTTNRINGKIYIGQTITNTRRYIGGGVYLHKAIKKYGKENFYKVILVDGIVSKEQMNCLEIFYIKLYDSTNPLIGYNRSKGGDNNYSTHTEEAKEKIRVRSNQEDNKIRIRQIQKIASSTRIGQHHNQTSKRKMMKTKLGISRVIEIYKDTILIHTCNFSSEASILTGVKRSGIGNNLCGLAKSAGGFTFNYKIVR
jgi:hypothetical protein